MADYSGALQSFETCSTLWTVPTFPLLAAALCAWWSRGTRDNERGASREARAGRVAILCAAISVLAALTHTLLLARLPSEERCLLNHIALSARIGTFDASISLSMDALTSLLSIVVSGAGLCVLVHSVATLRGLPGHNRRLAAISLGVGGMLIVCLASDFVFMFVGWGASGVATLLLVSENERFGARAARIGFVTARLADALLVAGICVLFWTFGGGFSEAGSYVPELKPRLVGVGRASLEQTDAERALPRGEAPRPGWLTMAALPESSIKLGGAELCALDHDGKPGGLGTLSRPCQEGTSSPFARVPVTAAMHDARVSAGSGTDELLVEKLRLLSDKETTIALIGPTLNLRELRDQLLLQDRAGAYPIRAAVDGRKIFGLSALGLALTLLVLAAAAKSAALPLHAWLQAETDARPQSVAIVAGAGGIAAGAILLLRIGFLLPLVPFAAGLIALIGGLGALLSSARAALASDVRRALALIATAEVGIVFVGIGSGARGAAALELSVSLFGVTALLLVVASLSGSATPPRFEIKELSRSAARAPRALRSAGAATLALAAAPIPALGQFFSREAIAFSAFQGDQTEPIPGFLLTVLSVAAATLISFAAFRVYYLVLSGERRPAESKATPKSKARRSRTSEAAPADDKPEPPTGWPRLLTLACATLALTTGLLGASSKPFDPAGSFRAPLERWLETPAVENEQPVGPGPGLRIGLLVIGFLLPLGAWRVASKWYGRASAENFEDRERQLPGRAWLTREPITLRATGMLGRDVDRIGSLLQRTDRWLAGGVGGEPVVTADADQASKAPERSSS